MRTFIFATAFLASSTMAHECNIDVNGQMSIKHNEVTLTLKNKDTLFLNGQGAWLDGQQIVLTAEQNDLVNQYHSEFVGVAPEVVDLAFDAVDIASKGVTLAFEELMGKDDELISDINHEFDFLRNKLKQNFYTDDGAIHFDSNQFSDDKFFEEELGQEFEQRMEKIIERSLGNIMVSLGTQILLGGIDEFEQKMEAFGETLENEMDFQSENLEERAENICSSLTKLDSIETQISGSIPELSALNVFSVKHNHHSM